MSRSGSISLRFSPHASPALLVLPASLLGNWMAEAFRFSPSLRLLALHPSVCPPGTLAAAENGPTLNKADVVLAFLMRFKQICNHPAQWLGSGNYEPSNSGKFLRLAGLCEEIAARQEKVLVFTQFKEITSALEHFLAAQFRRPGLVLHGETSVKARQSLVERFQHEDGPPFFILSLKADGTGLTLTEASHVIHFDRWWNPAVENQATDRAYRIGQKKNVLVHKFVCRGTVEEKIDQMLIDKRELASGVLADGGEVPLTEMSDKELLDFVALDARSALDDEP